MRKSIKVECSLLTIPVRKAEDFHVDALGNFGCSSPTLTLPMDDSLPSSATTVVMMERGSSFSTLKNLVRSTRLSLDSIAGNCGAASNCSEEKPIEEETRVNNDSCCCCERHELLLLSLKKQLRAALENENDMAASLEDVCCERDDWKKFCDELEEEIKARDRILEQFQKQRAAELRDLMAASSSPSSSSSSSSSPDQGQTCDRERFWEEELKKKDAMIQDLQQQLERERETNKNNNNQAEMVRRLSQQVLTLSLETENAATAMRQKFDEISSTNCDELSDLRAQLLESKAKCAASVEELNVKMNQQQQQIAKLMQSLKDKDTTIAKLRDVAKHEVDCAEAAIFAAKAEHLKLNRQTEMMRASALQQLNKSNVMMQNLKRVLVGLSKLDGHISGKNKTSVSLQDMVDVDVNGELSPHSLEELERAEERRALNLLLMRMNTADYGSKESITLNDAFTPTGRKCVELVESQQQQY